MSPQQGGRIRCPALHGFAISLTDHQDVGQAPRLRSGIRDIGDDVAIHHRSADIAAQLGQKWITQRACHGDSCVLLG